MLAPGENTVRRKSSKALSMKDAQLTIVETIILIAVESLQPGCRVILAVTENKRSRPSPGHGRRRFPLGQAQVDI